MTDPLGQSQVIPYLEGLSKLGYDITIISFEKREKLEKLSAHIQSILDRAGIQWKPLLFTRRPPFLSKLYDVWKLKKTAKALYRRQKFDFIHCRSYVSAAAGQLLARRYGVPFLFDMRGFWVDERVDNGQWDLGNPFFRFFYKRYKKKERSYFDESAHIISLTWKGKEELVQRYHVPAEKITVIPCCVDLQHFDYRAISREQIEARKEKLGIGNREKVLSYLGSLGGWYLEKEMLDYFRVMQQAIPGLKMLFITQDAPEKVFSTAMKSGVDRKDVIVQPASRKEVPLYLALSDWSIFFIKDAYSKRASSPTKQGEIMAMGVPLICNDIGDTGKIVQASAAGWLVREFTKEEFSQVAARVKSEPPHSKEQIRKAAFEYYDLQKGIESYAGVYKGLTR
jgi:glycosyltransferase involved in cell wall biosynthesis